MFVPPPFHERRPGLVAPVRPDPRGEAGPTRGQARGPRWRTSSHGLVVPACAEVTAPQRVVEAAAVLREDEAVTGWAALLWLGCPWFDGTIGGVARRDVTVVAKRHLSRQPGLAVSQEFLHPDEIVVVDGVPVTVPVRSVVFEMRYATRLGDAVAALDMGCYSDLVSLAEVGAHIAALGPVTGIQQARDAHAEADENSWSPQETRMRGVWTKGAGLPRPRCNIPVFTMTGQHVGTPDLINPELGLLGLYNGADHLSLAGVAADLEKETVYRDLGLEPVTMLATDWNDLARFMSRVRSAVARANGGGAGAWTVEAPSWWTPTHAVDLRRSLTEAEKARLLRYRRSA